MPTERKRNEATEANEKMNAEFNDGGKTPRPDKDHGHDQDSDTIKGDAAKEANKAARIRRPFA